MIGKQKIKEILNRAMWAPSGDNSQPWKFSIPTEDSLLIWNIPGKDNPILNYQQSGSLVAHGALIEIIKIVAQAEGWLASVTYFPSDAEPDCIASISFSVSAPNTEEQALSLYIERRASNRKHYSKKKLTDEEKRTISGEGKASTPSVQFLFSKDATDKKKVARALSTMEDIALQVPELHHLFFKDILWSAKENDAGIPGLYIKSLELPLPAQGAMRLLKHWAITRSLNNSIGLSKKIAGEMASVYRDSASYGAVFIEERSAHAYVKVGETIERAWLEATRLGIAVQPVTGLMFLAHRALAKDLNPIPESFADEILQAYSTVRTAFDAPQNLHLAFLLRFGHSKPPTARTQRLPPVIV